jgi:hypothetical protein
MEFGAAIPTRDGTPRGPRHDAPPVTINTIAREAGVPWQDARTLVLHLGIRPRPMVRGWVIPAGDVDRALAACRDHAVRVAELNKMEFAG